MSASKAAVSKAVEFLRSKTSITPKLGIICGTGLGGLVDEIENKVVIQYASIPGFSQPTGVEKLIVTCASGGLNPKLKTGDFVVLEDHISFSSYTTDNVLVGANDEAFGSRFVPTSGAYCPRLREQFVAKAKELGFGNRIHTGVYFHLVGPTFSSRAESRVQLTMGGDVVGMSTVPEVLTACHCGMTVVAVSLVTDMCAMPGDKREPLTAQEVYDAVEHCAEDMKGLVSEYVKAL